jgi:hypothetical protein
MGLDDDDLLADDIPAGEQSDAHQIALELMKQLITLASGVVVLSATFLEKLGPGPVRRILLGLSWLALVTCIFCALQTISVIVKSRLNPEHQWSKGAGQAYAHVSKYAFVIGIFLFAMFAFISFISTSHFTFPSTRVWSRGHL